MAVKVPRGSVGGDWEASGLRPRVLPGHRRRGSFSKNISAGRAGSVHVDAASDEIEKAIAADGGGGFEAGSAAH